MSAVAGSSGGDRKGSNDPTKKKDSKGGRDDDEEGQKRSGRFQCHICQRNLNISLEEHELDCPGERDWSGEFRCMYPGCGETVRYFGEVLRHWRQSHGKYTMPERMKNRLK